MIADKTSGRLATLKNAGALIHERAGKSPLIGLRPFVAPQDELMEISDTSFDRFVQLVAGRHLELTEGTSTLLQQAEEAVLEIKSHLDKAPGLNPFLGDIMKHGLEKASKHLEDAAAVLNGVRTKDL